jgi:hypothetical protein
MTLRFHLTPVEWLSSRKQATNAGDDVWGKEHLHSIDESAN